MSRVPLTNFTVRMDLPENIRIKWDLLLDIGAMVSYVPNSSPCALYAKVSLCAGIPLLGIEPYSALNESQSP